MFRPLSWSGVLRNGLRWRSSVTASERRGAGFPPGSGRDHSRPDGTGAWSDGRVPQPCIPPSSASDVLQESSYQEPRRDRRGPAGRGQRSDLGASVGCRSVRGSAPSPIPRGLDRTCGSGRDSRRSAPTRLRSWPLSSRRRPHLVGDRGADRPCRLGPATASLLERQQRRRRHAQ